MKTYLPLPRWKKIAMVALAVFLAAFCGIMTHPLIGNIFAFGVGAMCFLAFYDDLRKRAKRNGYR
jgi:hypothetical protein